MIRATELDKKIGNKIKSIRLAKGFSRKDIANNMGITHQQIAKYESGINRITVSRLITLANILGVVPEDFYNSFDNYEYQDNNLRLRMNIEIARNLQEIDNEEIQDGFLQLSRKVANQFKAIKSK